ncbi:SUKH-4 family immunity protein [Streptomyces sp. AS02]|uniref:SUKH-4 family immunity protein n=1 Tax=Streptomyces sp. AS02 TaxID=2938946 RepID=UPI002021E687|nr:SUKH-4 family immunity protein [Streptomyces sp. AS02]MCL8016837.1 SUKH-4 family immunity protein [Streptomyces sp. AS02]
MSTPIDRKTLESEFSPDELTTFSAAAVAGIRHQPSAHFLRQVGLPSRPNPWFDLVDGSAEQARTLGDCYDDLRERWTNLPENAESWLLVGVIPYDDIALDGVTGVVHCLPGDESEIYPLNKDLNSFARFLHLLEKERPNYDFESEEETLDPEGAARRLVDQMREIDPEALAVSHSRWHGILEYVACPEAR